MNQKIVLLVYLIYFVYNKRKIFIIGGNIMKYALVYYWNTDNVGDDILSYAAKRFLPKIDYYIDRESLDLFVPESEEKVTAILNGWYLHNFFSFPPSPYLNPLFVGTHFCKDYTAFNDYTYLENENSANYLKMNGPVGCRDNTTYEVMKKIGIDSYFSGCMTLTIEPFPDIEKNHSIVLTDVPKEVETYIKNLLPDKNIITVTHFIPVEERGADWVLREKQLEEYLKLYQAADLVITTRLHCALPSIALGTKAILISKYNDDWKERISDYEKYCTMFSTEDILNKKADDIICSPELICEESPDKLKEKLINTCNNFLKEAEKNHSYELPKRKDYIEQYVNRTFYTRKFIYKLYQNMSNLNTEYARTGENLIHYKSIIEKLLHENERLTKIVEQLKNEKN